MIQKSKKNILKTGGVLLFLFLFYKLGNAFAPGSYPYAEYYEFNYSEQKVIEAIEIVKKENITLKVGKGWEDTNSTDYWNHIYFNFHNQMLLTWLRSNGENKTTFAFVSIQDENSKWKLINDDLGFFENRKIKKEFEKEIVEKIKKQLMKSSH